MTKLTQLTRLLVAVAIAAVVAVPQADQALSPDAQLKAAMRRELLGADPAATIGEYRRIAATFAAEPVASEALQALGVMG